MRFEGIEISLTLLPPLLRKSILNQNNTILQIKRKQINDKNI